MTAEPVSNNVIIAQVLGVIILMMLPVIYSGNVCIIPGGNQGLHSISTAADK
ncbi:hypothetical protein [Niabella soli]|uniref:hypothetical protein n=1 Tax=Niabella soli TaxID=446683 RepID=UPI0002D9556B|nr:hypothetical protein [Niabella soli]